MSSQSPPPPVTAEEVKAEESIVSESIATATAPPTATATGVTKQELEVMDGIVHRLTNYRNEKYVCGKSFLPFPQSYMVS